MLPAKAQRATEFPEAIVITDPEDKQKIRGNVPIALAWGKQIKPPRDYNRALINLKDAMNNWTEIYTTAFNYLDLGSEHLLDIPFIIITTEEDFTLSLIERRNVKEYFEKGGFMVCDNARGTNRMNPVEKSFNRMISETLGEQAQIFPLSENHFLYHCFFDFENGPPRVGMRQRKPLLKGVWYKDQLVAVFSNMGYTGKWNDTTDNILQLKMGVNMVIFALIRYENITQHE